MLAQSLGAGRETRTIVPGDPRAGPRLRTDGKCCSSAAANAAEPRTVCPLQLEHRVHGPAESPPGPAAWRARGPREPGPWCILSGLSAHRAANALGAAGGRCAAFRDTRLPVSGDDRAEPRGA